MPGLPFQGLLCSPGSFSCPFTHVSMPGETLQHLRRVHSSLLCPSGCHLYLCAHLDTWTPHLWAQTPLLHHKLPGNLQDLQLNLHSPVFPSLLLTQGAFQAARSWISISRRCQRELGWIQPPMACSGADTGYICIWMCLQEDRKSLQWHIAEIQHLMKQFSLGLQSAFETSLGE